MTERSSIDASAFAAFDENYRRIREAVAAAAVASGRAPEDISLLAATKTVPPALINHAIDSGIDLIGENRVQELLQKDDAVSRKARRHMIGHLQTNKVRDVIDRVEMIESVHSLKLAETISRLCTARGKTMPVLLEVNIGREESKSGFLPEEVAERTAQIAEMSGLKVCGLMTIPPICDTEIEIRRYFREMLKLFIDIKEKKIDNSSMDLLSMGMSGDFEAAIAEGANLVRIGTALFGRRPAPPPASF